LKFFKKFENFFLKIFQKKISKNNFHEKYFLEKSSTYLTKTKPTSPNFNPPHPTSTHFTQFQPTSPYFNPLHPFTTETNKSEIAIACGCHASMISKCRVKINRIFGVQDYKFDYLDANAPPPPKSALDYEVAPHYD